MYPECFFGGTFFLTLHLAYSLTGTLECINSQDNGKIYIDVSIKNPLVL